MHARFHLGVGGVAVELHLKMLKLSPKCVHFSPYYYIISKRK